MKNITDFILELNGRVGIDLPQRWKKLSDTEISQRFLAGINEYFFQTYNGIGDVKFQDEELQFFSEFHKFWATHFEELLNAKIDRASARTAAQCLSRAVRKFGTKILVVTHDTKGLPAASIASVRFFTANQDFRVPPEDQFQRYLDDPKQFDPEVIAQDSADFVKFLGAARLSQTDKRIDFARNAAEFLVSRKIQAVDIAREFGNNAVEIRAALIGSKNMGYGPKKANMFIRDMVELGVWPGLSHYDQIDVASDINTMKVALRAKIIRTDIPLVSSFLDQFCYQYSYMDKISAAAWRAVWEEWHSADPSTAPSSPCIMDFLLYRIGREYCDDILVEYRCDKGHRFTHFRARARTCQICTTRTPAAPIAWKLPCQVSARDLPRDAGKLKLEADNLLSIQDGVCMFEGVCHPKDPDFRPLDPPKSISVKGQTGWTNSYSERERGGGGMMG